MLPYQGAHLITMASWHKNEANSQEIGISPLLFLRSDESYRKMEPLPDLLFELTEYFVPWGIRSYSRSSLQTGFSSGPTERGRGS
jgi:hypothetical protein